MSLSVSLTLHMSSYDHICVLIQLQYVLILLNICSATRWRCVRHPLIYLLSPARWSLASLPLRVSSYYWKMYPHTTTCVQRLTPAPCVSSYYYIWALFVSSYTYKSPSVSFPLHIGVLYYCMCPRTTVCVISRLSRSVCPQNTLDMLPYTGVCVLILYYYIYVSCLRSHGCYALKCVRHWLVSTSIFY